MSKENEPQAADQTATEPAPKPETPPEEAAGDAAPAESTETSGRDFVDFKEPKDKARFDRIYGHMKEYERVNTQLIEDNKRLFDKLNQLDATANQSAVNSQLIKLREVKRAALEAGDHDRVMQVDEQIMDLKASAIKKPEPAKPTVEPASPQPAHPSAWEERFIEWSAEVDDNGNFLRPWANPNHPEHLKAVSVASKLFEDERYRDDFDGLLNEVETRMRKFKAGPAAVLGSNPNLTPKSGKTKVLNEVQKRVAKAMGLTDAQYIEGMS